MVGQAHLAFGLITVFIAVFMLFYIFHGIDKIAKDCKSETTNKICKECCKFGEFGFSVVVILLILGSFTLIVCITVYILLTA